MARRRNLTRVIERARAPHVITGRAAIWRQYSRYADKPVDWAYDVGRIGSVEFKGKRGLDQWQEEVLDGYGRHKLVGVAGSKGVGKEFEAALIACHFASNFEFAKVPCCSVSGSQMKSALWPEIQATIARSPTLQSLLEFTPTEVYARGTDDKGLALKPRWRIHLTAAATRTSLVTGEKESEGGAGEHADNLLLIVTEASGWMAEAWRARMDTLTGQNNRAFVIGNPARSHGPFFDIFNKPSVNKHWLCFHVKAHDSRAVEREWIQRMLDTHGEDSAYVQANVFGQFPTSGSDRSVFTHAEVLAAFNRIVQDDPGLAMQVGVDCAAFGLDKTVAHARRGFLTLDVLTLSKSDPTDIVLLALTPVLRWYGTTEPRFGERFRLRALEEVDNFMAQTLDLGAAMKANTLFVVDDGGGYGGGPVDTLRRTGWRVEPMNNGWAANDPVRFTCRGDELWFVDGKAALAHCSLPYSDEFLAQLISREYGLTGKNEQRKLETKERMKARGLPSPDLADGFALAYADVRYVDTQNFRNVFRRIQRAS